MIRISHKRVECIGCAACTEIAPNYWKMDNDGLASLIEVNSRHSTIEFGLATPDDKELLEESAENCPVNIITIN